MIAFEKKQDMEVGFDALSTKRHSALPWITISPVEYTIASDEFPTYKNKQNSQYAVFMVNKNGEVGRYNGGEFTPSFDLYYKDDCILVEYTTSPVSRIIHPDGAKFPSNIIDLEMISPLGGLYTQASQILNVRPTGWIPIKDGILQFFNNVVNGSRFPLGIDADYLHYTAGSLDMMFGLSNAGYSVQPVPLTKKALLKTLSSLPLSVMSIYDELGLERKDRAGVVLTAANCQAAKEFMDKIASGRDVKAPSVRKYFLPEKLQIHNQIVFNKGCIYESTGEQPKDIMDQPIPYSEIYGLVFTSPSGWGRSLVNWIKSENKNGYYSFFVYKPDEVEAIFAEYDAKYARIVTDTLEEAVVGLNETADELMDTINGGKVSLTVPSITTVLQDATLKTFSSTQIMKTVLRTEEYEYEEKVTEITPDGPVTKTVTKTATREVEDIVKDESTHEEATFEVPFKDVQTFSGRPKFNVIDPNTTQARMSIAFSKALDVFGKWGEKDFVIGEGDNAITAKFPIIEYDPTRMERFQEIYSGKIKSLVSNKLRQLSSKMSGFPYQNLSLNAPFPSYHPNGGNGPYVESGYWSYGWFNKTWNGTECQRLTPYGGEAVGSEWIYNPNVDWPLQTNSGLSSYNSAYPLAISDLRQDFERVDSGVKVVYSYNAYYNVLPAFHYRASGSSAAAAEYNFYKELVAKVNSFDGCYAQYQGVDKTLAGIAALATDTKNKYSREFSEWARGVYPQWTEDGYKGRKHMCFAKRNGAKIYFEYTIEITSDELKALFADSVAQMGETVDCHRLCEVFNGSRVDKTVEDGGTKYESVGYYAKQILHDWLIAKLQKVIACAKPRLAATPDGYRQYQPFEIIGPYFNLAVRSNLGAVLTSSLAQLTSHTGGVYPSDSDRDYNMIKQKFAAGEDYADAFPKIPLIPMSADSSAISASAVDAKEAVFVYATLGGN